MIAIKGMKMPKSCGGCRLQDEEYSICFALCGMSTYDVRRGFRHSECPLVEVKGEGKDGTGVNH